jgi:hypothetical protein
METSTRSVEDRVEVLEKQLGSHLALSGYGRLFAGATALVVLAPLAPLSRAETLPTLWKVANKSSGIGFAARASLALSFVLLLMLVFAAAVPTASPLFG